MRAHVPAIRILPMSDKVEGFRGRSIEQVQAAIFLGELLRKKGRYRYRSTGLNSEMGTLVLFQFQARIIASGIFMRDERFEMPVDGIGGVLHFDPASICVFEPVDAAGMRKVWPAFRAFGHVKQFLNPTLYGKWKRGLRNLRSGGSAISTG